MKRPPRRGFFFESAPKKPPPERGIRMKKAGTTWWGQRWIEALEGVLRGDAGRLARGRTYARSGRTNDLRVRGGGGTAQVTGSRATPYDVTIQLARFDAATWRRVIEGMAGKAQFSVELLAGQMPQEIDEVFRAAGVSLFPAQRSDLVTRCTCPDWGDPCKHVAATHYVLGEALDRDPFLLFELRGMVKERVLEALRAARGASDRDETDARADASVGYDAVPAVTLGALTPADYDRPRDLPTLHFAFDAPLGRAALLRQLGTPAGWEDEASPADVLAPLVRAAAEAARRMAMAEPRVVEDAVEAPRVVDPPPRARKRRGPTRTKK